MMAVVDAVSEYMNIQMIRFFSYESYERFNAVGGMQFEATAWHECSVSIACA